MRFSRVTLQVVVSLTLVCVAAGGALGGCAVEEGGPGPSLNPQPLPPEDPQPEDERTSDPDDDFGEGVDRSPPPVGSSSSSGSSGSSGSEADAGD